MNVLLVTSALPRESVFLGSENRFPLGIGFLVAVLRDAGHNVSFIDNFLHPSGFPDNGDIDWSRIDAVGVHANSICYRDSLDMFEKLQRLRERGLWKGRILAGGPHPTLLPETIPDYVDVVVVGEGEKVIVDAVEGNTGRLVSFPRVVELDTLPRPAYDCFASMPYNLTSPHMEAAPVFTMNTSRGCPFACTFCSTHSIWGKRYTTFSPERIFDDIKYLQKDFGVNGIYFREDNFTVSKKRVEALCEHLIRDPHRVSWMCETRVDTVDRELLQLMKRAGCQAVYFGAESGCDRVLDMIKKGFTVDQTRRAVELCNDIGIKVFATFMVGIPGETSMERIETIAFMEKLRFNKTSVMMYLGIPGSKLYEECTESGEFAYVNDVGIGYTHLHDCLVDEVLGGRRNARIPWPKGQKPAHGPKSFDFDAETYRDPQRRQKLVTYLKFSASQHLARGHRGRAVQLYIRCLRIQPREQDSWRGLVWAIVGGRQARVLRKLFPFLRRKASPSTSD